VDGHEGFVDSELIAVGFIKCDIELEGPVARGCKMWGENPEMNDHE
jgi:hypothetical protein